MTVVHGCFLLLLLLLLLFLLLVLRVLSGRQLQNPLFPLLTFQNVKNNSTIDENLLTSENVKNNFLYPEKAFCTTPKNASPTSRLYEGSSQTLETLLVDIVSNGVVAISTDSTNSYVEHCPNVKNDAGQKQYSPWAGGKRAKFWVVRRRVVRRRVVRRRVVRRRVVQRRVVQRRGPSDNLGCRVRGFGFTSGFLGQKQKQNRNKMKSEISKKKTKWKEMKEKDTGKEKIEKNN